ncbi:MAG: sensor histidine kinase [Paracoccaceae bacterium]
MDEATARSSASRVLRVIRSINFQLFALLTIALLPVGAISVSQSLGFADNARRSAETLLLSLTAENVAVEYRLIEAGFSAADGLAIKLIAAPHLCDKIMADFIATRGLFSFAALRNPEGAVICSSKDTDRAAIVGSDFARLRDTPRRSVGRIATGPLPNDWEMVTTLPLRDQGTLLGFISIAVPSLLVAPIEATSNLPRPNEAIVVNADGVVLSASKGLARVADRMPAAAVLQALLAGPDKVFPASVPSGKDFTYAKVTLIPGTVYAIGIWPTDNPITGSGNDMVNAILFPLLMWGASLTVALLAARRLVIVPIRTLRHSISRFAAGERSVSLAPLSSAPSEIQDVISTFNKLGQQITVNEAALVVIAEEKLLLLRELHHRIKNTLQMISSIISIQRRKAQAPILRAVLRSLQDRVMSIALIDQSLYQGEVFSAVPANTLIQSIADRLMSINLEPSSNVEVKSDLAVVRLDVDQIVPLSLLANEAITNALKYVGTLVDGRKLVQISLQETAGLVRFEVVNSVAPDQARKPPRDDSTGLGMPLIRAFSDQLHARCETGLDAAGEMFRLLVEFQASNAEIVSADAADAGTLNAGGAPPDPDSPDQTRPATPDFQNR